VTGWVVTFYSYKGGVGRSSLLANAATLLATWGYRTLCIDWDIEAPGLDEYFRPWLGEATKPGLVELVTQFSTTGSANWREHVCDVPLPGSQGRLGLITSGTADATFMARVQAIRWRELYDKLEFGKFLERTRDEWKAEYDFIFIDSRTGITDIGGICTVHLPDLVVPVFTANAQSLEGVTRVLRQAGEQRRRLPLNRANLLTLPVPSRFDARGQDDLAKVWLNKFAERLDEFYENWLDADTSPRQLLDFTKIPYLSVWTFGERLAVLEERENDPERISYHFATIAALIARRLAGSDELVRNRDGYVEVAKFPTAQRAVDSAGGQQFSHEFFVSYSPDDSTVANEVVALLRSVGCRVFTDRDVKAGTDVKQLLYDALVSSQHLLMVGHAQPSRWQRSEAEQFFEVAQLEDERKIVLLDLDGPGAKPMDRHLEAMNAVRLATTPDALRDALAKLLPHEAAIALTRSRSFDLDIPLDPDLFALSEQYMGVNVASYAERVRRKDELALQLGQLVLSRQILRSRLANSGHDGLVVALAAASELRPESGDIDLLIAAGRKVTRLHAAFRVLSAILTIWDKPNVGHVNTNGMTELLSHFSEMAQAKSDSPLLTLVETARRKLAYY
jgi:MinD-like ATPase involved in chromosome partitioning or flagellar assembly